MPDNKNLLEAVAVAATSKKRCEIKIDDPDGKLAEAVAQIEHPMVNPFDQKS